jgi:hypothetical protein
MLANESLNTRELENGLLQFISLPLMSRFPRDKSEEKELSWFDLNQAASD